MGFIQAMGRAWLFHQLMGQAHPMAYEDLPASEEPLGAQEQKTLAIPRRTSP
jgi:hypothetical protein